MEGIERIKERILEEAREEADQKLEDAETEAQKIEEKAQKKASRLKQDLIAEAENEAEATKDRIISMAELEMKKKLLSTKQEMITRAFDKSLEKLKNLEPERYQELIASMIISAVDTGEEEIIFAEGDMDKLSDDFLEKLNKQTDKTLNLTFSEEKRNIEGGFILKGEGIENNNSFESLIRMERDNIETKIAELLFQN